MRSSITKGLDAFRRRSGKQSHAFTALLGLVAGLSIGVAESWAADPFARDRAAAAGLSWTGGSQGDAAVLDYDKDGDFDVVPSRHGGAVWPIMRNNDNGTFTQVFGSVLVRDDRHGCVAADFGSPTSGTKDGRVDIYCIEGACRGGQSCAKENDLVYNLGGSGFSANLAPARGVADIHGRGRDIATGDFNGDGRIDIAVANEGPSFYPTPNRLFLNTASGNFTDVNSPVRAEKKSLCVAAGDLTGDGRPELVFCAGDPGESIRTLTYRNNNGTFVETTGSTSYKNQPSRDVEITKLNGDNINDLLIVTQTRLMIWLGTGSGLPSSPSYTRTISEGRDVAIGDVNLDGKPDIYLCTGWRSGRSSQEPDLMLLNDGTGRGFRSIPIPQVSAGDGDNATPIPDWQGTGRMAVLVNNSKSGSGHGNGPTQFIVFSAN
jgi:FG-GAP-like repeat